MPTADENSQNTITAKSTAATPAENKPKENKTAKHGPDGSTKTKTAYTQNN